MIGLSEDTRPRARGRDARSGACAGGRSTRPATACPCSSTPRSRLIASGRACRAVKAAAAQGDAAPARLLRALRLAWFTTTLLLDADEDIAAVADGIGLDGAAIVAGIADPAVEAAYQRDRAEARRRRSDAARRPWPRSGRPSRTTAPGSPLRASSSAAGRARLVAGGWQPFDAYDLCVANLAPDLPRRPAPEPADLLAAFPDGLTTVEVARGVPGA